MILTKVKVNDDRVEKYNFIVNDLALDWSAIKKLNEIDIQLKIMTALQSDWYMPDEYKNINVTD